MQTDRAYLYAAVQLIRAQRQAVKEARKDSGNNVGTAVYCTTTSEVSLVWLAALSRHLHAVRHAACDGLVDLQVELSRPAPGKNQAASGEKYGELHSMLILGPFATSVAALPAVLASGAGMTCWNALT